MSQHPPPPPSGSKMSADWATQPADRRLVEELFIAGHLTPAARLAALNLLYPRKNWQFWIARLLLTSSVSLLLSSVIYFFAFNWGRLSPALKLGLIEVALIGALGVSIYYSLEYWVGKLALLVASILVGVFLAVLGQIYQTGADAYELFIYWAGLILPWVLLARCASLWAVWIVVVNLGMLLYWEQQNPVGENWRLLICPLLAVFNGLLLVWREFIAQRGGDWLASNWTRNGLTFLLLLYLSVPTLELIFDGRQASAAGRLGAGVAILGHLLCYGIYRTQIWDLVNLVFTLFSACILVELGIGKLLLISLGNAANPLVYLLLGAITLALFTATTLHLRQLSNTSALHNRELQP